MARFNHAGRAAAIRNLRNDKGPAVSGGAYGAVVLRDQKL
jgi:hypothetical protein